MLTIFSLTVLLFSVMLHEIAHGSAALSLGDPTAKNAGRLSLNPVKHLDPLGSVFLPLFLLFITAGQGPIFGWAKPVPINPQNFRDREWGEFKVAIAGPLANFLLAIIFGIIVRFFPLPITLSALFNIIIFYNLLWGLFNLIPIPPLDGSHIIFKFFPAGLWQIKFFMEQYGLLFLILFVSFGLRFLVPLVVFLYQIIVGRQLLLF